MASRDTYIYDEGTGPAAEYRSLITCSFPTGYAGAAIDVTGKGGDANIRVALTPAVAWSNKGYLTTAVGTTKGAVIDKDVMACDFDTQSFMLAFTIKRAASGALTNLMGNADLSTGFQGMYITERTSGAIRPIIRTAAGVFSGLPDTNAIVFDNTDHNIFVAVDGPKKSVFVYVDGDLDVYVTGGNFTVATPTSDWNFGCAGGDIGGLSCVAMQIKNFHALVMTGSLPSNLSQIARRLNAAPHRALLQSDIKVVKKSVMATIIGQSNEAGAGEYPGASGDFGCPRKDAQNGAMSMWPLLQNKAGKRNTWLEVFNGAVGSTSILHNWVGVLRAWSNNMLVSRGTYVLAGGNVYKNTTGAASNTTPVSSTVQPTGTAATQTGADNIQWTYMGAARAQDVAGYIYPHTDAYFDPNGFIAAAYAGVNRSGFDSKIALISIGQGDKTFSTIRAEFALGLRRVADFFLANSVKVAIGFTCYAATTGAEAWYQSDLLPGWSDAVANYAGNPNVIAGANLRNALGVLSVTPTRGPGLKVDQLHMNNVAYALASAEWDRVLAAAGWI